MAGNCHKLIFSKLCKELCSNIELMFSIKRGIVFGLVISLSSFFSSGVPNRFELQVSIELCLKADWTSFNFKQFSKRLPIVVHLEISLNASEAQVRDPLIGSKKSDFISAISALAKKPPGNLSEAAIPVTPLRPSSRML